MSDLPFEFDEHAPIIAAFQTLEGFKGEWSERPGPAASTQRLADVGEAWVTAMLNRHGIGLLEASACGLWVCNPTVDGVLPLVAHREITQRQGLETSFFSGWWNAIGTAMELPR